MWRMKLKYRTRYWWRKAVVFFGVCPTCWNRVNYTSLGRAICPQCGKGV